MTHCSACGAALRDTDRFCSQCGTVRGEPPPPDAPPARAPGKDRSRSLMRGTALVVLALLIVVSGIALAGAFSGLRPQGAGSQPTAPVPLAATVTCALILHAHNAALVVTGPPGSCALLQVSLSGIGVWDSFDPSTLPSNEPFLCGGDWGGMNIAVYDTGGQFYGGDVCSSLRLPGR